MRTLIAVTMVAGIAFAAAARADDRTCEFNGTMFSDGATTCQSGSQMRCDDGEWEGTGVACPTPAGAPAPLPASPKPCDYQGTPFSSGAASCQAGTQFRCDDGTWRSLNIACRADTAADAPAAGGLPRTCMNGDGSTVASGSTICRSGTTFVCANGEWESLNTPCR